MKNRFGYTGVKTLLCVLLSTCLLAKQPTDSLTIAMDSLFKPYNRLNGPGCAVAVIRNQQVLFTKGYGMANLEYDIPITPSTVFDIASVSKQFTGLAISTLIEEGKLKLDDDIRTYLPEIPKFSKPITIRHLLHHTSGLRDWPDALIAAGWRWDEVFSFEDIMRMVSHQKDLDFEPGERYSYSNTGYNLLALLVEKVSGKPFDQWTSEVIFKPLQMENSRFLTDHTRLIKNLAYSYSSAGNEFVKSPSALTAYGSSSLFTTVVDLSKWIINFDRQVSLKNPIYTRMLTEGRLTNGNTVPYGYGLEHATVRGLTSVSHTGGWASYRTILTNFPSEKLSIVVLSNDGGFNVTRHAMAIATIVLKDKFKPVKSTVDGLKDAPTIRLNPALAKKYEGTYQLGPGWAVTLSRENNSLMVQATGEPKFPTQAKSDSTIWIDAYGSSMTFITDKTGAASALKYRNILAKRIIPWTPGPDQLPLYVGIYYSPELASEYTVDLIKGTLKIHHRRLGDFDLNVDPAQVDGFSTDLGILRFIKDKQKKITGFRLSGSRAKNIWFKKR